MAKVLPSPSWSMGPSDVSGREFGPAFSPAINLKNQEELIFLKNSFEI